MGRLGTRAGRHAPCALQALRELRAGHAAQLGWQHVQRQLAERALVVAGRKFDQRHPRLAQRRHRVEHLRDRTQRSVRPRPTGRHLPHQPRHFAPAERHTHQRAGRQGGTVCIVQRVAQPRVAWRLDHHLHPGVTHTREAR
jgi:hypothetical protein